MNDLVGKPDNMTAQQTWMRKTDSNVDNETDSRQNNNKNASLCFSLI